VHLDRPDRVLKKKIENSQGVAAFPIQLDRARCVFLPSGISDDAKCFSPQEVENSHSQFVPEIESNEVIELIPYLSPELIAAILTRENTAAVDLHTDSKSAREDSLSAVRSQSAINEKRERALFRQKIAWLPCSRIFAVACKLVVLWPSVEDCVGR
jgi:hypothetical protein